MTKDNVLNDYAKAYPDGFLAKNLPSLPKVSDFAPTLPPLPSFAAVGNYLRSSVPSKMPAVAMPDVSSWISRVRPVTL